MLRGLRIYRLEKQILCKQRIDNPISYFIWYHTGCMECSVVFGELYLGLIHVSCVMSHFSSFQRVQHNIGIGIT